MDDKRKKNTQKCPECDYWGTAADLRKHVTIHTGERPYSCSVCGKTFRLLCNCKRHEILHTGIKFECTICLAKFSDKCTLQKHKRFHTGVGLLTCSYCQKKFVQKGALRRHVLCHTQEKPFKCPSCNEAFSKNSQLRQHIQTHDNAFTCEFCYKIFVELKTFQTHRAQHLRGSLVRKNVEFVTQKVECPICHKIVASKPGLKNHMLIHTGEKPFHCENCDKAFQCRSQLESHKNVHLAGNPVYYYCKECDKKFKSKNSLVFHMKQHLPNREVFKCSFCDKEFFEKRNIVCHVRRKHAFIEFEVDPHDSEEVFECSVCKASFSSRKSCICHEICVHRYVKPTREGDCKNEETKSVPDVNEIVNPERDEGVSHVSDIIYVHDELEGYSLNEDISDTEEQYASECEANEIEDPLSRLDVKPKIEAFVKEEEDSSIIDEDSFIPAKVEIEEAIENIDPPL